MPASTLRRKRTHHYQLLHKQRGGRLAASLRRYCPDGTAREPTAAAPHLPPAGPQISAPRSS